MSCGFKWYIVDECVAVVKHSAFLGNCGQSSVYKLGCIVLRNGVSSTPNGNTISLEQSSN